MSKRQKISSTESKVFQPEKKDIRIIPKAVVTGSLYHYLDDQDLKNYAATQTEAKLHAQDELLKREARNLDEFVSSNLQQWSDPIFAGEEDKAEKEIEHEAEKLRKIFAAKNNPYVDVPRQLEHVLQNLDAKDVDNYYFLQDLDMESQDWELLLNAIHAKNYSLDSEILLKMLEYSHGPYATDQELLKKYVNMTPFVEEIISYLDNELLLRYTSAWSNEEIAQFKQNMTNATELSMQNLKDELDRLRRLQAEGKSNAQLPRIQQMMSALSYSGLQAQNKLQQIQLWNPKKDKVIITPSPI